MSQPNVNSHNIRPLPLGRVLAFLVLGVASAAVQANPVVYTQAFDGTAAAFASQNDVGGNGLFAQVFDNFTLGVDTEITDVHWTGAYFNPATEGTPTAWTIYFCADATGAPGACTSETIAGTANQTSIGPVGGFPANTYSVDLMTSFLATAGTQYWLSVVPDLGVPPQWGWGTSTGGDGVAFQDFGSRSQLSVDLAFDLTGVPADNGVPEPATLALLGLGLAGLGFSRRRKPG